MHQWLLLISLCLADWPIVGLLCHVHVLCHRVHAVFLWLFVSDTVALEILSSNLFQKSFSAWNSEPRSGRRRADSQSVGLTLSLFSAQNSQREKLIIIRFMKNYCERNVFKAKSMEEKDTPDWALGKCWAQHRRRRTAEIGRSRQLRPSFSFFFNSSAHSSVTDVHKPL